MAAIVGAGRRTTGRAGYWRCRVATRTCDLDLRLKPAVSTGCRVPGAALAALLAARRRVHFEHADLVGYSVFEEAFTLGHQAAA